MRGISWLAENRLAPSPYRTINTFHFGYKNQSVYAVSGTSRCLFSDKYKTHKYSVGRVYSCWMLNWWCITWPVGFERFRRTLLHGVSKQEHASPDRAGWLKLWCFLTGTWEVPGSTVLIFRFYEFLTAESWDWTCYWATTASLCILFRIIFR